MLYLSHFSYNAKRNKWLRLRCARTLCAAYPSVLAKVEPGWKKPSNFSSANTFVREKAILRKQSLTAKKSFANIQLCCFSVILSVGLREPIHTMRARPLCKLESLFDKWFVFLNPISHFLPVCINLYSFPRATLPILFSWKGFYKPERRKRPLFRSVLLWSRGSARSLERLEHKETRRKWGNQKHRI